MKIHEHQGKDILRKYGVPTPRGRVALNTHEALLNARMLGGSVWVVKAQIHAGGRGKAGGVKIAKSLNDVRKYASELIGKTLVTKQTGPEGKVVQRLLIEEGLDIKKEYYAAIVVDRESQRPVIMASSEGGMEIEEVAERTPEKIIKVFVDPAVGLMPFQIRNLCYGIGVPDTAMKSASKFFSGLYACFDEMDCSLVEVNPMILTADNQILALDAKITFDDNAVDKHKELMDMRDFSEEAPQEIEASLYNLNYIALDGNIACMVNGAGLAMATMDIIKLYGGNPANFLDVGGGATKENVIAAFKIILQDPKVKGILVNIFGGIVRCDVIAEAIVAAAKEIEVKLPLVVRLEGTNVEKGKAILESSELKITPALSMADGAEKIVRLAK